MIHKRHKKNNRFALFITIVLFLFLIVVSFAVSKNKPEFVFLISIMISIMISILIYYTLNKKTRLITKIINTPFPEKWKKILSSKVVFYRNLSFSEKQQFEKEVQLFIAEKRITGIKITLTDEDKLLVAASAIIPIFRYNDWEYKNLSEVLVYPDSFNKNFETGKRENILGMVGTGYMNRIMILSKRALHYGFQNPNDKKNVGLHEFIHLIDGADGSIDGVPEILLDNQYLIPWIDLIEREIKNINEGKSSINFYGATNRQEFFAVASEYFFERPNLLYKKHPELYKMLDTIFRQNLTDFFKNIMYKTKLNRNDKCFCGSELKFKHCCGKK